MIPATFKENIAHIRDAQGNVFQVLNEEQTDWDEAATSAAYAEWLAAHPPEEQPA